MNTNDYYYLGRDIKTKRKIWLQKPSWDCGWYWGFGYVQAMKGDKEPSKAKDIDFPDSIVSFFEGMMGQPEFGFPEDLQKVVLKGKKPSYGSSAN